MPRNSEQNALLNRLLSFYKRRYDEQSTMESKFNDAVKDLIDTGDISHSEYIQFCIENDVEPVVEHKPKPKKSSNNYTSSGCGGGYTRSSC